MTSPLEHSNKGLDLTQQDTFDSSLSYDHRSFNTFSRKRVPGRFTKTAPTSELQVIDELMARKHSQSTSTSELFKEFEDITRSLLQKNDTLIESNTALREQNRTLKAQVKELEYQIALYRNSGQVQGDSFSLMSYFNSISLIPIVEPVDGNPYELLQKNLCACKNDSNSNIRAFYLSMLQHKETRKLLNQLICHYENDDSWKLVPLLSTNESWVQLSVNFFKVLDSSEFSQIQQIYSFINESQLYDIIFISALRSRVQFLAEDYDSQIQTMTLYTGLCNIFGNQKISFNRKQHIKYDTYNFQLQEIEFTIYFIEDINQYTVSFYQPQKLFSSVESFDALTPPEQSIDYLREEEEGEENLSRSGVMMHCDDQ